MTNVRNNKVSSWWNIRVSQSYSYKHFNSHDEHTLCYHLLYTLGARIKLNNYTKCTIVSSHLKSQHTQCFGGSSSILLRYHPGRHNVLEMRIMTGQHEQEGLIKMITYKLFKLYIHFQATTDLFYAVSSIYDDVKVQTCIPHVIMIDMLTHLYIKSSAQVINIGGTQF